MIALKWRLCSFSGQSNTESKFAPSCDYDGVLMDVFDTSIRMMTKLALEWMSWCHEQVINFALSNNIITCDGDDD